MCPATRERPKDRRCEVGPRRWRGRLRVPAARAHLLYLGEETMSVKALRSLCLLAGLTCAGVLAQASEQALTRPGQPLHVSPDSRIAQLIQANVIATHAYQVLLARRTGRGSLECYSPVGLSDSDLEGLVEHQRRLLLEGRLGIREWAHGRPSRFKPSVNLEPILKAPLVVRQDAPVNVATEWLTRNAQAKRNDVRAIASLFQTVLEIDRDGGLLQEQFDFYAGLDLQVFLGSLRIDGSDAAFLAAGRELAPRTCASPFDTGPEAWQIAARKVWNWAEKKLHIRDEWTIARELLAEPGFADIVPRIESLPAQKVAVIGHSFTMGAHWSSPSSFVPIVSAIFELRNRKVEFRQFYAGGLTASRAQREFCEFALEWKPDKVLLVVLARGDEDYQALEAMGKDFRKAGIVCLTFDNIHDPEMKEPARVARFQESALSGGITVIEVDKAISTAPERERFLCLDGIHMTEPYHRLMAREWLKFLVGAGPAHQSR